MPLDGRTENFLPRTAMKAEMLDAETELKLAYAWRDERCEQSLHRLINAYMRLAISQAAKFKRYGAPMGDLIQEAGLGLMKAAEKFDPDRGVRFSTYAVWWIKASVQEYVMRNWSMVRTGSTSPQKSLFFNMRRIQARIERDANNAGQTLDRHQLQQLIAQDLGVPLHDVEMMDGRLSGSDFSLNATQSTEDEGREWIDALPDDSSGSDRWKRLRLRKCAWRWKLRPRRQAHFFNDLFACIRPCRARSGCVTVDYERKTHSFNHLWWHRCGEASGVDSQFDCARRACHARLDAIWRAIRNPPLNSGPCAL